MKNKGFLTFLMLLFLSAGMISAQENGSELKLSLKDAQDYAIKNNKMVISSTLDTDAARRALWATISSALPQVNASASFNDNLKLMTTLLPGDFFGKPGEMVPVRFGTQYSTGAAVTASLVIFNAPLLIGIQTSKLASMMSQDNLAKTQEDTKEQVSQAYYLILVSEKSLEILNSNIANLSETLKSTRSMFAAGMAESTDVDQMVSNLTMVENSRSALQRTIELNYNMLRFQLGVSASTKIVLTENLDTFTGSLNVEELLAQEFKHEDNVNYKLIADQEKMSSLALNAQKASFLPTLAGFYNYGNNGMGNRVSSQRWFPNVVTGLQLSVPIFASGQRYANIKKAEINLEKARNTKDMITEQLLLQEKQLRYNLLNANLQYKSQKDNIDVSKRVYASVENKYKQGMASSLELTQSNSLYLQAENNYISALMNLLQTKLALDKLLNNMK